MNRFNFLTGTVLILWLISLSPPLYAQPKQQPEEFIIEGIERGSALSVFDEKPPESKQYSLQNSTRDLPGPAPIQPPPEKLELDREIRSPIDQSEFETSYGYYEWGPMEIFFTVVGIGLLLILL